jgi:hypothetical protein
MSLQRFRPELPIPLPTSDDDNIIVSWKEGIVNSSIDEKLRAKSKSTGLQHAMDILGESIHSESKFNPHSSVRERATDETSRAELPPLIDPGDISEPSQPHPQEWNNHSTSELQPPSKTPQQTIEMINKVSK